MCIRDRYQRRVHGNKQMDEKNNIEEHKTECPQPEQRVTMEYLNGVIMSMGKKLGILENSLSEMDHYRERLSHSEEAQKELDQSLKESATKIISLSTSEQDIRTNLIEQKTEVDKEKIALLLKQQKMEEEFESLKLQNEKLVQANSRLESQNIELRSTEKATEVTSVAFKQITQLNRELQAKYEEDTKQLTEQNEKLNERIDSLVKTNEDLQKAVFELQKEKKMLEFKLQQGEMYNEQLCTKISVISTEIFAMSSRLRSLQAQLTWRHEMAQNIVLLSIQLQKLNQEKETAENEFLKTQETHLKIISELRITITNQKQEIDALSSQNANLTSQNLLQSKKAPGLPAANYFGRRSQRYNRFSKIHNKKTPTRQRLSKQSNK
eukprot:TRINITY_DN21329_c0_g1_i2.p1 TRINITY_DN21329_c0_g1~~TRINITY_DN21329_c0_g1_i2.p1  ORF type:complete len:380 (-),score=73.72 TRINITY_DN21329_c0_g1_i2:430-1569(-)